MRGRKPKPIHEREAEQRGGSSEVSHRPLPAKIAVGGELSAEAWTEPPEHLPEDAKAAWARDVSQIIEAGIADVVDVPALEGMCIAYARARQAERVLRSEGLFTLGSVGQMREHPALKIEREAWATYFRMAEQFGVTPISRTRLGMANVAKATMEHDLMEKIGSPKFHAIDGDAEEVSDGDG